MTSEKKRHSESEVPNYLRVGPTQVQEMENAEFGRLLPIVHVM